MKPLVHLYIPTYQAVEGKKDFFIKMLQSLLSIQYENFKIFISDDGSTDATLSTALALGQGRIEVLLKKENNIQGKGRIFSNWNRCVSHALESSACEYVGLFHQDDLYDSLILEKQIQKFLMEKDTDVVFTGARYMDSMDRPLHCVSIPQQFQNKLTTKEELFLEIYTKGNSFFICPSALFKKSIFEKVGLFSLNYANSGDLEMWLRILFEGNGRLSFIPEPLICYRLQEKQASARYEKERLDPSDFFEVMEHYSNKVQISKVQNKSFMILKNFDLLNCEIKKIILNFKNSKMSQPILFFSECSTSELKSALGWADCSRILLIRFFYGKSPSMFWPKIVGVIAFITDMNKNKLWYFLLKLKK